MSEKLRREGDKDFTFYWRTGQRNVFPGRDPAEALNNAGFGGGAIRALDFYADGDDSEWQWIASTREWIPAGRAALASTRKEP